MALVGFMLVGYLMSQRGGGAAPVAGRRVSPGGSSNLPSAESGGRVHNKGGDVKPAMGNKPAPTKVRAKNEPREDDKWLGVSWRRRALRSRFSFFSFAFVLLLPDLAHLFSSFPLSSPPPQKIKIKKYKVHNKYAYEVDALSRRGADVVFYGDSVFEAFRGTKVGIANKQFEGVPAVWSAHFKAMGRGALDLAVSGDTASNLLWRVRNGESPAPLDPKVLVVNVGTNDIKRESVEGDPEDLASGAAPGRALAAATAAVVDTLLEQAPKAHVVLLGVFPRGDENRDQQAQPSKYSPTIDATNAGLKEYAKKKGGAARGGVTFVDCGHLLLEGGRIRTGAMPDATHPSAQAYEELSKTCLAPAVTKALAAVASAA